MLSFITLEISLLCDQGIALASFSLQQCLRTFMASSRLRTSMSSPSNSLAKQLMNSQRFMDSQAELKHRKPTCLAGNTRAAGNT